MRSVLIVARLSLIEAMRRQIYLLTLLLACLMFVLPMLVTAFDLAASVRVVKDVSLTLMGYFSVLCALFFGSVSLPGEIERKTAFPLLARPMSRRAYLWGKWLGMMGFIALSMLFLMGTVIVSMAVFIHHHDPRFPIPVGFYVLEAGVLSSACLFFSTFASPALAATLGIYVYIMGGLSNAFVDYFLISGQKRIHFSAVFARFMKGILPDFQLFHIKDAIVHGDPVATAYLISALVYGLAWIVLLQLLAEWSFSRRDL